MRITPSVSPKSERLEKVVRELEKLEAEALAIDEAFLAFLISNAKAEAEARSAP